MLHKRPLRTLLLEDDPAQVMLLELELDHHLGRDLDLTQVESLSDALNLIEAAPFDVALVDLGLADTSGPHVVEKLKAAAPDMLIIVCTGRATDAVRDACLANGAHAVLTKQKAYSSVIMNAIERAFDTSPQ